MRSPAIKVKTLTTSRIGNRPTIDCENASRTFGMRIANCGFAATSCARAAGEERICPAEFGSLSGPTAACGYAAKRLESWDLNALA